MVPLHRELDVLAHRLVKEAERLRALGELAPGSFDEFARLTTLPQMTKMIAKEADLVHLLMKNYEAFITHILSVIDDLRADPGTIDILTVQLEGHQKSLWMLRAHRL